MEENEDLALKVCNMHETGFKLTYYQSELTFIQELFLNKAYKLYNEYLKSEHENTDNKVNKNVNKQAWKRKYREKVENMGYRG